MINIGKLSQITMVVGWIPHELMIVTNEQGNWQMKFNVRTYDDEDTPVLIPCIAFDEMAKNLYDEFEKNDSLVIWGQIIHQYSEKSKQTYMMLKVKSYSIIVNVGDFLFEPSLSVEKQTFLRKAAELFDNNAPLPSDEEVKYWREHWQDRKKKAFEEKLAKKRVEKK